MVELQKSVPMLRGLMYTILVLMKPIRYTLKRNDKKVKFTSKWKSV